MKKSFAIFSLVLFVVNIYGVVLLFPQRANAEAVPTGTMLDIPANIIRKAEILLNKLDEVRKNILGKTMSSALDRVVLNFTARLSSSIGKTLAEGGKGGGSFFDTRAMNKAVNEAGEAALGDAIDAIGQGLGVNLCLPPDIKLGLSLQLGKAMEPSKPKCSFKEFKDKWKKFGDSFSDEDIFSKSFSLSLDPAQSEVSQAANAILSVDAAKAKAEHEAELRRLADKGWFGVEENISGEIKTPPDILDAQAKANAVVKIPGLQEPPKLTGFLGTDVGLIAGYNFSVAFLEGGMKRLIAGLFKPQPPKTGRSRGGVLGSLGSGSSGGAKAPDVQGVSFSSTGSEFDLLSEFVICPEIGQSIYNCVLDQNFAQAIRDGLTIREAIKNNFNNRIDGTLLNVTLPFGYGGADGQQQLRHDSGYAYHNLKKLRRARIIPVGWELAAEIVKARRKPATLGDVLKGFNDPDSPFYRLVDPDWLLKAPLYYCKATAPGQLLAAPGSEDRMEYCVDLQDCVAPTEDGNGCQSWGYCTRERNTWRFDAKQCAEQFNTCLSYKRESDNQTFAFNKNTTQSCDASEVGCRWYALQEKSRDNKGIVTWNPTPRRYFNRTIDECTSQANGCNEFARLTDKITGRPLTVTRYAAEKDAAVAASKTYEDYSAGQNAPFATKRLTIKYLGGTLNDCRGPDANPSANVGCERFTPTSGVDAPVPAVLQSNDECPTSCVGYDAYEEVPSIFSKGHFPEYFIPSSARACTADAVGCEEFTNLDAVGKQGEAKENFTALRQCQKPATDSRTYYTWVGTEKTGYQLETHSLKASNLDGGKAPCTTRDFQNGNVCNEVVQGGIDTRALCAKTDLLTNPDCREFYDAQGNISYRLYSKTIVSSDACIRYRMTRSEGAENCSGTGGEWSGTSCIYLALPQESRSCSAEAVGCREYKGNTANDIRIVVNETFETTKDAQGAVIRPPAWITGTISPASIAQNGHSLASDSGRVSVRLGTTVQQGRTYLLSFYASGTGGNLLPTFTGGQGFFARTALTGGSDVPITSNWRLYNLGPVFVTWTPTQDEALEFNSRDTAFFIDNIVLKEVRDNFYLIKDSWTTPRECLYKQDAQGDYTVLREGDDRVIGCRAYTDRAKNPYAVKAFHQLCKEEFVGCEALINTKNTIKPEQTIFTKTTCQGGSEATKRCVANTVTPSGTREVKESACEAGGGSCVAVQFDDVVVPQDDIAYVVNDPKNYCAQSEKGCSAMSAPQAVEGSAPFAASTVYLLNDPERYRDDTQGKGSILCAAPNLACEAYTKSAGGEDYFIDPYRTKIKSTDNPMTCEWKQWPEILTQQFGWFKKGSSAKEPDCGASTTDGSGTPTGYVRECPAEADRCSQFVDPQDLSRSAVELIINESFEAATPPPGWNTAASSTVLTTEDGGIIEQKALRASGGRPYVLFTLGTPARIGKIRPGGSYRLSFWVKGNGGNMVTWFGGASTSEYFQKASGTANIPVTNNWTYHRLTRVATADESAANQDIRFEGGGSLTDLYLDGVELEAITDANDAGRPFYVIDDETITKKRDRTLCSVVDQKAGCVLFQSANKGAAHWDSTLSYQAGTPVSCDPGETVCVGASDTNNGKVYGKGTDAATCEASKGKGIACIGKDVNDLLKVRRDRVCGEWLSCLSGTQVLDKKTQKPRDICYLIGSCTEPSLTNAAACGKMKDMDLDPQLLDVGLYKARDLTWQGKEYAGYSIPYQYPVTSFAQLPYNIDPNTKIPEGYRLHNLALRRGTDGTPIRCTTANKDTMCGIGPGKLCFFRGKTLGELDQGYCYEDQGSGRQFSWPASANAARSREIAKSCRAYPATDAPFPTSVVELWQGTKVTFPIKDAKGEVTSSYEYTTKDTDEPELSRPFQKQDAYRAANVSQKTTSKTSKKEYKYNEAECSYYEVRYTDGETRFWGTRGGDYPDEIVAGSGIKRDAIQLKYGWQGYCLETDPSSPVPIDNAQGQKEACLTWFPVDIVQGEIDVNADAPEAGYTVASNNRYYCVETREEEQRKTFNAVACSAQGGCFGCPSGYIQTFCGSRGKKNSTCEPYDVKTGQRGNGWYPYDGTIATPMTSCSTGPNEKLRTVCTKLALISDNADQNLGWTERLRGPRAANPRPYILPSPLSYFIDQPSSPYGAADVTGIIKDVATNSFQICNQSSCDALVVQQNTPHAGNPYVTTTKKYEDGIALLQNVFARGFGVWQYSPQTQSCVARCVGGVYTTNPGECDPLSLNVCPAPTGANAGACVPAIKKVCQGGTVSGTICTLDSTVCEGGGTCVNDPSGTQLQKRVCQGGTYAGQDCSFSPNMCEGGGTCANTGTTFNKICDSGVNAGIECLQDAAICNGAGSCVSPLPSECTIPQKSFVPITPTPTWFPTKNVAWDFAGPVNAIAYGPEVRAAKYDAATQSYSEGNPGITIDTKSSGDYSFDATAQAVSLKFYAYNANGQQMPLKRVIVDWDDNSDLSATQGSLKNRKNVCQRFCGTATVKNAAGVDVPKHCSKNEDCGTGGGNCRVENWGDDVNACIEDTPGGGSGYFTYTHIYRCEGPVSPGWNEDNDYDSTVPGKQGACVFVPRVQVLDNWGWCNGSCEKNLDGTNRGCYNDPAGTRACESTTPNAKAWTKYAGRVILKQTP